MRRTVCTLKDCAIELGTLTTPPFRFWSSIWMMYSPGPLYRCSVTYSLRRRSCAGKSWVSVRTMVSQIGLSPKLISNSGRSAGALSFVWVMTVIRYRLPDSPIRHTMISPARLCVAQDRLPQQRDTSKKRDRSRLIRKSVQSTAFHPGRTVPQRGQLCAFLGPAAPRHRNCRATRGGLSSALPFTHR